MSTVAQKDGDNRSTIWVVVALLIIEKIVYNITQDTVRSTIVFLPVFILLHRYAELHEDT